MTVCLLVACPSSACSGLIVLSRFLRLPTAAILVFLGVANPRRFSAALDAEHIAGLRALPLGIRPVGFRRRRVCHTSSPWWINASPHRATGTRDACPL